MLTPQQINFYNDQGYLLAPCVFSQAEIDELEVAFDTIIETRLKNRANLDATWGGDWKKDMGETRIIHTHDVQAYSSTWAKALFHDRLTGVLSDAMGTANVQLHHTKLFQKPPQNGSGFPMHQDAPYFPHAKHTMTAAVIYISDMDEDMGCFGVYPGTHKLGLLPQYNKNAHYLDPQTYPIEGSTLAPGRRGDVLLFNYLTVHGSPPNRSDKTRKSVLIQVRDPEDLPTENTHLSHAQGMMLRGVNPLSAGEKSASGTLNSGTTVGQAKSSPTGRSSL